MIKEYLENDFREDVKNIFNTEPSEDGWFCIGNYRGSLPEIRKKNLALSKKEPDRHFVLSSIFLFLYAVNNAVEDEKFYNHTIPSDGIKIFYEELTGWPQVWMDFWMRSSRENREEGLQPKDVNYILDNFGLMKNGIPDRSSEFMLSCIFATMQGLLNKVLLIWNVSDEAKVGVSQRVQSHLNGIQNVLKAGYKPIEPEQEQEKKDVDLATPQSNLYNAPDDVFEDI